MKISGLILLLTLSVAPNLSFASSGIEFIIAKDHTEEVDDDAPHVIFAPSQNFTTQSTQNWGDGFFNINLSIDKMRAAVAAGVGQPDANAFVLILFSFAALLQMVRVTAGHGSWIAFIVRVIVVLCFLKAFNPMFEGVRVFVNYINGQLLSGQSAYDALWSTQYSILDKMDFSSAQGVWAKMKSLFSMDSLFYILVIASYIFVYAIYVLVYLVQACIIIALQYFGPLIISLALIPETDFSSGYIASVLKVSFWTVIMALLIRIMSTIVHVNFAMQLSYSEFISICAMNLCFAFAFLFVPIIAEMVFSGHGWSALGLAMTKVGGSVTGKVSDTIGAKFIKPPQSYTGRKIKEVLGKTGESVRFGAHKSINAIKNRNSSTNNGSLQTQFQNNDPTRPDTSSITVARNLNKKNKKDFST